MIRREFLKAVAIGAAAILLPFSRPERKLSLPELFEKRMQELYYEDLGTGYGVVRWSYLGDPDNFGTNL